MCNEFDISLSGSRVRQSGSSPRSVCVTPLGSRLTVHPSQPLTRRRPSAFITTVCSYSIQPSAGGLLQPCIYNERPRTETGVCRVCRGRGGASGGVFGGGVWRLGGRGRFVVSSVCTSSVTIPYSRRRARGPAPGGGRARASVWSEYAVRSTAKPKGSTVIRLRRNFQECLVTRTN